MGLAGLEELLRLPKTDDGLPLCFALLDKTYSGTLMAEDGSKPEEGSFVTIVKGEGVCRKILRLFRLLLWSAMVD